MMRLLWLIAAVLPLGISACAGQGPGLAPVPTGIERVDLLVPFEPAMPAPLVVYKSPTAVDGTPVNTTFTEAKVLQASGAIVVATLQRRVWDSSAGTYRDLGSGPFQQLSRWANANRVVLSDSCRAALPQVQRLRCTSRMVSSDHVRRLTGLRSLTAGLDQLDDSDLKWIGQLQHLGELRASRNGLRNLAPLARLKRLHTLDVSGNPVDGPSLVGLLRTRALTSLTLDDVKLPTGLWHQARLEELETLSVGGTSFSDADLLVVAKRAHRLQSLSVRHGKQLTDGGVLAAVPFLRSLRSLNLEGVALGDAGVEALAQLESLEELDLRFVAVTDRGLRALGKLTRLKRLHLRSTDMTCAGLTDALTTLPRLESLAVMSADLQCETNISALPNLRGLWLDDSGLGVAFLRDLGQSESVQRLSLQNTQLRDKGLAQLASLGSLRWLHLFGTRVSRAACETFNKTLGREICTPP